MRICFVTRYVTPKFPRVSGHILQDYSSYPCVSHSLEHYGFHLTSTHARSNTSAWLGIAYDCTFRFHRINKVLRGHWFIYPHRKQLHLHPLSHRCTSLVFLIVGQLLLVYVPLSLIILFSLLILIQLCWTFYHPERKHRSVINLRLHLHRCIFYWDLSLIVLFRLPLVDFIDKLPISITQESHCL